MFLGMMLIGDNPHSKGKKRYRKNSMRFILASIAIFNFLYLTQPVRADEAGGFLPAFEELQKRIEQLEQLLTTFSGSYLLFEHSCPDVFVDVTNGYDGRYITVKKEVAGQPKTANGNGDHSHAVVKHTHTVAGHTHAAGEAATERRGGSKQNAAHKVHSHYFESGTSEASHSHSGGNHVHSYVGFRLCKYVGKK